MTSADRVSSAYASIAEAAGDETRAEGDMTSVAGREASADAGFAQPGQLRGPRAAVTRAALLRRAGAATAAIALLGIGLIVTEDDALAPPPAAASAPGATGTTVGAPASAVPEAAPAARPDEPVSGSAQAPGASDERPPDGSREAPEPEAPIGGGLADGAADDETSAVEAAVSGTPTSETRAETGPSLAILAAPRQRMPGEIRAATPVPPAAADSARALARGYIVQLGVFADPGNADSLSRELAAQGYPARLQSRVVLGPFPDRQAAKAAAESLRRERALDGIIVPPPKP